MSVFKKTLSRTSFMQQSFWMRLSRMCPSKRNGHEKMDARTAWQKYE